MSVRRIFAEKKEPYAVKAQELMEEMSSYLDIHDAKKVRVLIRYDVENLSDETYEKKCICLTDGWNHGKQRMMNVRRCLGMILWTPAIEYDMLMWLNRRGGTERG